ncbi:MAG: hypothetical protein QOJ64_362 [Acidobacteriota bacterium]|jgi:hypothetical protein|nr:hypothetical protein [Acidobacteriota bacterium]
MTDICIAMLTAESAFAHEETKVKSNSTSIVDEVWPSLPLEEWKDTYATLHMWTQIVGKIRLRLSPPINHWWQVPLYVDARGLTTSAMPYGSRTLQIGFDFIDHQLLIETGEGASRRLTLEPRSVADFYRELMTSLRSLDIEVKISPRPDEVPNPIPFAEDEEHAAYDAEYANRCWRILVQAHRVFEEFRARFIGKCSPVHFFWGSFDLAVTRFSGRPAPPREGADKITAEAYSHEVISHGFWPGSGPVKDAAFYSYTAPAPSGLDKAPIRPAAAFYSTDASEFLFMYDDVRRADSPDAALMDFLQSTYEAGADLANWDRRSLERDSGASN